LERVAGRRLPVGGDARFSLEIARASAGASRGACARWWCFGAFVCMQTQARMQMHVHEVRACCRFLTHMLTLLKIPPRIQTAARGTVDHVLRLLRNAFGAAFCLY
jgi:hypothetical protein